MVIRVLSSISTYVWRQLFLSASLRFNIERLKTSHMLYLGMLATLPFYPRDSITLVLQMHPSRRAAVIWPKSRTLPTVLEIFHGA